VVAISQLSRVVEATGTRRPQLSHLRESGELEQVSDLVLFIYREEYYDAAKARAEDKEHTAEIRIAKHRNGPVGDLELFFNKEHGRFRDLDRRHMAAGS
jgi:replicative DNA helicase